MQSEGWERGRLGLLPRNNSHFVDTYATGGDM